jgi:4-hydroxybenzoate polyprenyltransferase
MMLKSLLITMRPKQWIKNLFIFTALVFAEKLFELQLLARTIIAFALFCIISSCVYLVNDLADMEKDRRHPPSPSARWPRDN